MDRLKQQTGKTEVTGLRRDYNNISLSRLIRDKSMQPEYYSSLMRLRAKIVALRKSR